MERYIFVSFMSESATNVLLKRAELQGMTDSGYVWLFSDGGSGYDYSGNGIDLTGAIGMSPVGGIGDRFTSFSKQWGEKWNHANEIITDMGYVDYVMKETEGSPKNYSDFGDSMNSYVPYAFDAMEMLLRGIQALADRNITGCGSDSNVQGVGERDRRGVNADLLTFRQALSSELAMNTSFIGLTGLVEIGESHDSIGGVYRVRLKINFLDIYVDFT